MGYINSFLKQNRRKDKLNILTFLTHERYCPTLCRTGHEFYAIEMRPWKHTISDVPSNYHIIPFENNLGKMLDRLDHFDFDIFLLQTVFEQADVAKLIYPKFNIPAITLEHTDAMPYWSEKNIHDLNTRRLGRKIFITDYSRQRWLSDGESIDHAVDTDTFTPGELIRDDKPLTICNDFINRDLPCGYSIWRQVVDGMPHKIFGHTPGLSEYTTDLNDTIYQYQTSKVFLNTTQYSPVPMALLEAMSCGCVVVSTNTCAIPEIITHGVNGFLSNDVNELREYIKLVNSDDKLREQISNNARQTILDRFNLDRFVANWNDIFYSTISDYR